MSTLREMSAEQIVVVLDRVKKGGTPRDVSCIVGMCNMSRKHQTPYDGLYDCREEYESCLNKFFPEGYTVDDLEHTCKVNKKAVLTAWRQTEWLRFRT
jgi:hypothetical protein